MSIIVQKFGGSSVASTEKLFNVCHHIIREYDAGNQVVVVVSAQGKTTDKLVAESLEISDNPNKREMDVLLSIGEQITISKLCLCLEKRGYNAVSMTGWQVPIITNNTHGDAKIKHINKERIKSVLESKKIVVIAGFQGIDENENITTLGRGGSDTSAVAIAAALQAEKCEIYTDVDGIYSTDPKIVDTTKKIEAISYDEMLELASLGAKVLHNRCVEIGMKYDIPIVVKSSFAENSTGTLVDSTINMEHEYINGVTKDDKVGRITLLGLSSESGKTYNIFKLMAENKINVDIIVQSVNQNTQKDLSFTVNTSNLNKAVNILKKHQEEVGIQEILYYENLSKISIVGLSMVNDPGIAAKIFEALYENNINMYMISTSEIKVSVVVDKDLANLAVQSIHDKFFK